MHSLRLVTVWETRKHNPVAAASGLHNHVHHPAFAPRSHSLRPCTACGCLHSLRLVDSLVTVCETRKHNPVAAASGLHNHVHHPALASCTALSHSVHSVASLLKREFVASLHEVASLLNSVCHFVASLHEVDCRDSGAETRFASFRSAAGSTLARGARVEPAAERNAAHNTRPGALARCARLVVVCLWRLRSSFFPSTHRQSRCGRALSRTQDTDGHTHGKGPPYGTTPYACVPG